MGTNAGVSDIQFFQGNSTVSDTIQIQYGIAFNVDFVLGAIAYPTGVLSGSADYSHTARLTGIQVFDSNMNPVSNPSFSSASGQEYTVSGAVPEPGTWLLLGSGLAAFRALGRCRRRA